MSADLEKPSMSCDVCVAKPETPDPNSKNDFFEQYAYEDGNVNYDNLKSSFLKVSESVLSEDAKKFSSVAGERGVGPPEFSTHESFILPDFSNTEVALPNINPNYWHDLKPQASSSRTNCLQSVETVLPDQEVKCYKALPPEEEKKKSDLYVVELYCDNITYGCNQCGKSFTKHSYLMRHKRTHEDDKKFLCQFCGHLFRLRHQLAAHLPIHTNELPFHCSCCDKKFRSAGNLSDHKRKCVGVLENISAKIKCRPYICDCGKCFETANLLQIHKNDYHKPHRCVLCGALFLNKPSLTRHMNTFHSKFSKSKDDKDSLVQCSYCEKLLTKVALKQHLVLHSGDKKKFTCDMCSKSFSGKYNLQVHRLTHLSTQQRPHKCEKCGKGFIRRSSLLEHMTRHSGQMHYCDRCDQPFKRRDNLQRHMKEHDKEKEFVCTFPNCDKKFMRKCYLKVHLKRHRGEKDYCCPICYKESVTKSSLNVHMKVVHKITRDVFGATD